MAEVRRRKMMMALGATLLSPRAFAQPAPSRTELPTGRSVFAPVVPGYPMRFPHDEGSHPDFGLEWWYITGWLNHDTPRPLGFQITFFRARPALKQQNPSAFTPRQILIAHAALSDPANGRLIHAERAARAGFDLAAAEEGRTRVWIDEWSLAERDGGYHAAISWNEARFELVFDPRQPPLLQGDNGFSRKGPAPLSASYYYSLPHLAVQGMLHRVGRAQNVSGTAWLDHEWSSQYMDERAVGWDWTGINFEDGGALMLFRMRDRGEAQFWAGGTLRRPDGTTRVFLPSEIRFTPGRVWRSPRTGTRYPVSWRLDAGDLQFAVAPLMDDQEHDTRASTGTIYWEGAVRAFRGGAEIGRGYLELTGYWRPVNLSRHATPRSRYRLPA